MHTWQSSDVLHGNNTALIVNWLANDPELSALLSGGVVAEALYGYDSDKTWVSVVRAGGIVRGVFDRPVFDVEVRSPVTEVAYEITQLVRKKFSLAKHELLDVVGCRELYGPARREDAVQHMAVWGFAWQFTVRT